jgi:hypothetical protein
MALTLVFTRGKAFYVGDNRFEVVVVHDNGGAVIQNEKEQAWHISAECAVNVLPNVNIAEGYKGEAHEVKLVFDAPRTVPILREELYIRSKTIVAVDDT